MSSNNNHNNNDKLSKLIQSKYFTLLIVILFVIIFLTRFVNLDADPSFVKRVSDIADEGIFGLDARNKVLFDEWFIGDMHIGLDSAPLYSYLLYHIFDKLGVSFLTLRLLPAISGFLIMILLYFLVKKLASKKEALLALLMYGFGSAPFIYNRLGHLESTLTLFLLLTFIAWYFGGKRNIFYALAGLFYGIAVFIKFTAIFFFPAIALYWLYHFKKNELKFKQIFKPIFCFGFSSLIPLVIYLSTFLIPHWDDISKSMLQHSHGNLAGLIPSLLNIFKLPGSNLFGLPSLMILIILFLIYLLFKLSFLKKFTIKKIIEITSPLEAMALSWISGGLLGILFSDVSDRRLTIMFVPIIILISYLIINFRKFSVSDLYLKISSNNFIATFATRFLWYNLLLLPLFSFPYLILRLIIKGTVIFDQISVLIFLTLIILSFIITAIHEKTKRTKSNLMLNKFLLLQFIFFFIFDPLTTCVRHFSRHLAIIFSLMGIEKGIIMTLTIISFYVLITLIVFRKRKEFHFTFKIFKCLIVIYFMISLLLISNVLFFPNYTTVENSNLIKNLTESGTTIIGFAEGLLYETDLLYLYYQPNYGKFSSVNDDLEKYHPRYFLYLVDFDGTGTQNKDQELFAIIKEKYNLTLLTTIKQYRYPFTDKYKFTFELYELSNKSKINLKS